MLKSHQSYYSNYARKVGTETKKRITVLLVQEESSNIMGNDGYKRWLLYSFLSTASNSC